MREHSLPKIQQCFVNFEFHLAFDDILKAFLVFLCHPWYTGEIYVNVLVMQ